MNLPELCDLGDLSGKRVLVRADFNVPLTDARISDERRIGAVLPTLERLHWAGARVKVCSHLGRPAGRPEKSLSLAPVRSRLNELAPGAELLENLRFDPGEVECHESTVDRLVSGCDAYLNEAFGVSHRRHASVVGPPARLPSAAGPLLVREVKELLALRSSAQRPFVVVLGGAKLAGKLEAAEALCEIADHVLIGGALCFTFLAAAGRPIGASYCDHGRLEACRAFLERGVESLTLPSDFVGLSAEGCIGDPSAGGEVRLFEHDLPAGWRGVDIGPSTSALYSEVIRGAATVFWNGPMGAFEDSRFSEGTKVVAEAVAGSGAYTVVGGGDSGKALRSLGLVDSVCYLSTGGGAAMELLARGDLVGLAALRESARSGAFQDAP